MTTHAPAPDDTSLPAALRAAALAPLWAEAKAFVGFLFEMFSPARLREQGISRRGGARLSIFLANVEAGLRRLILVAALAFTPPAIVKRKLTRPPPPRPATPAAAKPRRAGLRIIHLPSADGTPAIPSQLVPRYRPPQYRPYGHIPFPGDPLLSVVRAKPSFGRIFAVPTRNPLDRWGRLSRRDPDWRPPIFIERDRSYDTSPDRDEEEDGDTLPRPKRKRNPPQANEGLPESLWDWRRCHNAWNDPVPAPDFAARLDALRRAIDNPQALITHTARRLQASREAARAYAATRAPNLRRPTRTLDIDTSNYRADFAPRCHARILDSS
jgi:hypothetical protein